MEPGTLEQCCQTAAEGSLNVWLEILIVPALLAAVGSLLAFAWPTIQRLQRQRRFKALLHRELEEIGPTDPWCPTAKFREDKREDPKYDDKNPRPRIDASISWTQYLSRRFVHERFLRPQSTDNEFLLSLDPELVYFVSQLWMAYDSGNHSQWNYYLGELVNYEWALVENKNNEIAKAHRQWCALKEDLDKERAETEDADHTLPAIELSPRSGWRSAEQISGELLTARLGAYAGLLPLTKWSDAEEEAERLIRYGKIRDWMYEESNALLLSGDALAAEQYVEELLNPESTETSEPIADHTIKNAMSALRTELKIDLGVRSSSERHVPLRRWTRKEEPEVRPSN